MNRKLLTSILLCAVFLLRMGATFAMPSADAYERNRCAVTPAARCKGDGGLLPRLCRGRSESSYGTAAGCTRNIRRLGVHGADPKRAHQLCHHPPRGRRTRHHSDRRGDPLCHFGDLRRSLSLHGRWKISLGAWRLRR